MNIFKYLWMYKWTIHENLIPNSKQFLVLIQVLIRFLSNVIMNREERECSLTVILLKGRWETTIPAVKKEEEVFLEVFFFSELVG